MILWFGLALLVAGLVMTFVAESQHPRRDYLDVFGILVAGIGGGLILIGYHPNA